MKSEKKLDPYIKETYTGVTVNNARKRVYVEAI
jgi:hypothetical protein